MKHDEFVGLGQDDYIVDVTKKMRTPIIVDGCGVFHHLIGRKDILCTGVGIEK